MTATPTEVPQTSETSGTSETEEDEPSPPRFILYLRGPDYAETLRRLTLWTHRVLLPVYGREATSASPWCPRWWEHPEAVAQLHGLWLAWDELTGPGSEATGPAVWHRDHLPSVMESLRDPQGPFAGCKPGTHRAKEAPAVDAADPFGPPPPSAGVR
ncbi:DUF4913 domain-containing protein [Streptomyces antibioticus]|uniref:DUF4913 domain-containing protein n=1 Tax=Streptomyces antibioticus TaxID=1890 RepID=UPI00225416DB|nr:DUF4913 domain-containing protein [Streptomyces antibioticus]MCX4737458.1 DUF4913 domain-containing protein [Streptomyces antibioticus]MCX5170780.1 DUF4913 domain-containing protein [Streptomyces antibioticus]